MTQGLLNPLFLQADALDSQLALANLHQFLVIILSSFFHFLQPTLNNTYSLIEIIHTVKVLLRVF